MGSPHTLSEAGATALADVARLDAERRAIRTAIEAQAERLIADTCRDSELALGEAVARALREGVPHTRVGRQGMSTRDWNIVDRFAALADAERVA